MSGGIVRGCGVRIQGAIYSTCGMSENGQPVEAFLIDPPRPVPAEMGLTPRGVLLKERAGIWHIFDWVGEVHYPNVSDFVEEARRFGLSRRLPDNLDFSKITPESRHILVHPRAWVGNVADYLRWNCPKRLETHTPEFMNSPAFDHGPYYCCAGVWWRDAQGGEPFDKTCDEAFLRAEERRMARYASEHELGRFVPVEFETPDGFHPLLVRRHMPSFDYFAHAQPDDVQPQYAPAFFMSFPIARIEVIKGEKARRSLEKAGKANVPVAEVEC